MEGNAGPDTENGEPLGRQCLNTRGKTPSPPLTSRVIVYDCEENSVHVKSADYVLRGMFPLLFARVADSNCWD